MAIRSKINYKGLRALRKNIFCRLEYQGVVPRYLPHQMQQRFNTQLSENKPTELQKAKPGESADDKSKTSVKRLTVAEADEALRLSMRDIDGGGECSLEMEGGKFVGLRRGVKDNMFRLI
ncbi:hypothetical protein TWF730_010399 [Orbilia blumenaviensis]|uniref:Uncharacterized protein n=1 Tax=Orbilia blumenaviensis TaxID=1796055 RepID=A0AAV9UQN6_9PEZI